MYSLYTRFILNKDILTSLINMDEQKLEEILIELREINSKLTKINSIDRNLRDTSLVIYAFLFYFFITTIIKQIFVGVNFG